MALGPTHYDWRRDVARIVREVERRWPEVKGNTYEDHPWPGWDHVSVDFWDAAGRGHPIRLSTGWQIRQYLYNRTIGPRIRHTIYLHQLWTSFGGYSRWVPDDHSGNLRHLHLTYWK